MFWRDGIKFCLEFPYIGDVVGFFFLLMIEVVMHRVKTLRLIYAPNTLPLPIW